MADWLFGVHILTAGLMACLWKPLRISFYPAQS